MRNLEEQVVYLNKYYKYYGFFKESEEFKSGNYYIEYLTDQGKFELNINNISINKNNYLTLRKEYGAGINSENLDEEMMKFVIDSRNFDEKFLQISLKEDLTPTQYEQKEYTEDFLKTSDYSIKEISQKLTDGEHLIVKVPFKIQRKKGTIREGFRHKQVSNQYE